MISRQSHVHSDAHENAERQSQTARPRSDASDAFARQIFDKSSVFQPGKLGAEQIYESGTFQKGSPLFPKATDAPLYDTHLLYQANTLYIHSAEAAAQKLHETDLLSKNKLGL